MDTKLKHFNTEFNCNTCFLKDNGDCQEADKTTCKMLEVGFEAATSDVKAPVVERPAAPQILCGQHRCYECPNVLC